MPNRRISMICDRSSIHSNMSSICTGSGNSPVSPSPRSSLLLSRRRPMSQFWGLSKVDEDEYDNVDDWRATQGASTTTTLTSNTSDQCSTRSNSTRSSSSSSIRTVSENTNPGSKFLRMAQKAIADKLPPSSCEQGMPGPSPRAPTPIVSTSSSVYPSRWRDMIRSSVIIGESTNMSTTTRPASAVGNGPPSPSIITNASSIAIMSGTSGMTTNNNTGRSRRSSLLLSTPSIHKKEVKAISVWRNTVSQLLMQSDEVFYHTLFHPRKIGEMANMICIWIEWWLRVLWLSYMHCQGSSPLQIHHEWVVYYWTIISSSFDPYSNSKCHPFYLCGCIGWCLGDQRDLSSSFFFDMSHRSHICTFKTYTHHHHEYRLLTRYGLLILEIHAANDGRHT